MFKKLKDKIAEEVKISPKLQASVQQFAQAMVSPSSSISSIQESTSNDNFSIAEESEVSETPRNSPEKDSSTFQRVDLRGDVLTTPPRCPPASRSRRSSASSMMSDVSSLFPVYESPNNAYHFQSDLESTSEFEEISGSTSHLQSISKEQLLIAYRKTQSRYHKYKGRYVDLARHFKELERQNGKIKAVLTETQDRALRKIAELKEQCALEQKAKAHLEDALRNDLEEKDHLIDTLKTKVKLLKYDDVIASKSDWPKQNDLHEDMLVDIPGRGVSESDSQFSVQSDLSLQEKVMHLEAQLSQYQQSQKEYDEKFHIISLDKAKIESAHEYLASENISLKKELETQRRREEEAALSLAENKMQVHRELEAREEEAKKLKALVAKLRNELRASNQKKNGVSESTNSTTQAESIPSGSVVIEDSGAGGDGLPPSFPASTELMQLKEVLRAKYKEIEVLATENGKLRASILMTKSHNDSLGPTPEESEHDLIKIEMSKCESTSSSRKGDLLDRLENWMADEVSLECSSGENFLQKHKSKEMSDYGLSNFTSDLSGESSDFFSIQQHNNHEGRATKLGEIGNELAVDRKWESRYCEIKRELDRLVKEEEEMRELLALNVSPSESVACSDDGYRASESNVSLVESLTSVLGEKRKWKEEVDAVKARLDGVSKECNEWKETAEMLKSEKKHLGLDLKRARDESDRLKRNLEELKQANDELQKSKDVGDDAGVKLAEIARKYDDLKNELSRVCAESKIERERLKAEYMSEVSLALATLEEKEKELERVKERLQSAVFHAEQSKVRSDDDLMARCVRMEEELFKEREKRLVTENSMNTFQNGLCKEFLGTLSDGRFLLHEALKRVTTSEQEVDRLKAQFEGSYLQEEETKKVIQELRRTCDEQMDVLQKSGEKAQLNLEKAFKERDEARSGLNEAQQMAAQIECEKDALAVKKQEAESRALKVENELKVVRELEERAKVEAEEAIHEQEAMRRSWEMQREQIESMSREIERLKKAEDGLIRVLKEVREEVKNKEMEVKRAMEESAKERKAISLCEEKLKSDICSLKKSMEEISSREEQLRKELEKSKEISSEWKTKSEAFQQDLESSLKEKKSFQKKLESKEEESLKSSEAIEKLTQDLSVSMKNEKEIKSQLAVLMQEMDSLKALLVTNKEEVKSLMCENRKLDTTAKDFEGQIEVLRNDRDGRKRHAEELVEELNGLRCERDNNVSQLKRAKEELEKMEGLVHNLKESQEGLEEEVELTKAEKRKFEENWEDKEKKVTQMQIEIAEITKKNEELEEELDKMKSKSVSEINSREEEVVCERVTANKVGSAPQTNGTEPMTELEAERDEAIKKASSADERIKSLEGEILALNERTEAEKRSLEEEVKRCSEELRLRREGNESEADLEKLKEELRRVIQSKENLEKSLVKAEEDVSRKGEWGTRVTELEELVEGMRREYNMSITSREEEHQEELSSYSEKMEAEVEYIRRQLMEEIKGLREELVLKGNEWEYLLEDHNRILNEKEAELDELRKIQSENKEKAENLVESETSKWACHVTELEMKNKETLEALKKQWDAEKRELEVTSKVAVAAVESGTGSMTYLKRQIQAQARELSETKRKYSSEILELRHLLSMQKRPNLIDPEKSSLDDSTELEYLRNILYEYMMGKEPMVLAKVIAAVVKFDDEQTKKILIKEEQKQTLLGQFGLT